MFENIIGQETVVARLTTELLAGIVPPALLFHGPDYSGKGSVALEFARVVTCSGPEGAPWSCSCRDCTLQRHLLHPDTLLVGGRYFTREIAIAADALKRDKREPIRFLFARAVRKLTRRFDPVLWENDEAKLKSIAPALDELDERLEPFLPGAALPAAKDISDEIDRLVAVCDLIVSKSNLDGVPVNVIRRLSYWSRLAPAGAGKVAIIENIDRLQESSRNALLKTLEEPPGDVYFVLTTSRRGAVISTILSRVRRYGFLTRDAERSAEVIRRIFRDEPGATASIRDYFTSKDGHGMRPLAERFLEGAVGKLGADLALLDEIAETIRTMGGNEGFRYFLEELTNLVHVLEGGGAQGQAHPTGRGVIATTTLARWRASLNEALMRVETYNVQVPMALEGLYYGIRGAA